MIDRDGERVSVGREDCGSWRAPRREPAGRRGLFLLNRVVEPRDFLPAVEIPEPDRFCPIFDAVTDAKFEIGEWIDCVLCRRTQVQRGYFAAIRVERNCVCRARYLRTDRESAPRRHVECLNHRSSEVPPRTPIDIF